jgi:hypothetical protein
VGIQVRLGAGDEEGASLMQDVKGARNRRNRDP